MASQVVIEGLPQLQNRLRNMQKVGSSSLMREVGETFVAAAKELVPKDTHALEESIHVAYAAPRAVGVVAGGQDAPYAQSQEYGARDHQIYPNRARRLRFFWKREGRMFYGRTGQPVSHPGNKPQPFFWPVLRGFAAAGLGSYIRTEATKTFNMIDMIRVDLVNHWNAGA